MKAFNVIFLSGMVLLSAASCSKKTLVLSNGSKSGNLPPGQIKKVTGSQSAAPYAPGQQKKKAETPSKKSAPSEKSSTGQNKKQ